MTILLILLSIHFVADFMLQTDWQAQNKSKNDVALIRQLSHAYALAWAYWLVSR